MNLRDALINELYNEYGLELSRKDCVELVNKLEGYDLTEEVYDEYEQINENFTSALADIEEMLVEEGAFAALDGSETDEELETIAEVVLSQTGLTVRIRPSEKDKMLEVIDKGNFSAEYDEDKKVFFFQEDPELVKSFQTELQKQMEKAGMEGFIFLK